MNTLTAALIANKIDFELSGSTILIGLPGWRHNLVIDVRNDRWTLGEEIGSGTYYEYTTIGTGYTDNLAMLMLEIKTVKGM